MGAHESPTVLSAIGLRPRTTLAEAAGITCAKGIVTNRRFETGIDGIYAMGDCAEIAGFNLPFIQPIMLQAKALARTLTGTPTAVHYPAMPVVVKTPACPVVVCPPPVGAGGTWECEAVERGFAGVFPGIDRPIVGFCPAGQRHDAEPIAGRTVAGRSGLMQYQTPRPADWPGRCQRRGVRVQSALTNFSGLVLQTGHGPCGNPDDVAAPGRDRSRR